MIDGYDPPATGPQGFFEAVDALIRSHGLAPRFHRDAGYWQVVVYARLT